MPPTLTPAASPSPAPLPLPCLRIRAKPPASWWREADTRALLVALHHLGWIARKGAQQGELLTAILRDPRWVGLGREGSGGKVDQITG